jgi:Alginate export
MTPRRSTPPRSVFATCFLLFTLAIGAADAAAFPAQSALRAESSPYRLPRYEEDWSDLGRSADGDWLDRIKFVRLGRGEGSYLSIGGELRETYERFHNPNFGLQPQDPDGYLLERYLLHADVHLGSRWRGYVEVLSALAHWRVGGARPLIDQDTLDFHQGFVEFVAGCRDENLKVRLGRQEWTLGSGRLIALREGPNVPLSFDGARLTLRAHAWTADVLASKPVETRAGILDDPPQAGTWFWGVYLSGPATAVSAAARVDAYYLGWVRGSATFNQGTAREQRSVIGVRLANSERAWLYDSEGMLEFGSFGTGRIRAWRVANDVSYRFPGRWRSRIALAVDIASGDHDRADGTLETFNALFQSGTYSGRAQILGPANTIRLEPSLSTSPFPQLAVSAGWGFYWRESIHDGLYGIAGNLLVPAGTTGARYEGSRPILQVDWQVDRHWSVHVNYIYVFNGPFGLQAIHGTPGMSYVSPWASYRF